MKVCTECGATKPYSGFHRLSGGIGGVNSKCKVCRAEYKRRTAQPDRYKEGAKRYRERTGKTITQSFVSFYARNPEARRILNRAHAAVYYAIRTGALIRPSSCEECGRSVCIEAAHYDYSRPLVVRWLCRSCHRRWDYREPKLATLSTATES